MSDDTPDVKPEEAGNVAPEVQPEQSSGIRYTETMAEAKAKIASEGEKTAAEELGVDQASYDKYYKNGEFDWASYGKEQAFKAKQKPAKEAASEGDGEEPKPAEAKASESTEEADTEAAKQAVSDAGLDWDNLANQVLHNGDISKEDREKLSKMVPEHIIDNYISMVNRDTDAVITKVVEGFGGEDHFTEVFNGLQENATGEQRDLVDQLLGDEATFDEGVALARKLAKVEAPAAPATQRQEFRTPNANSGAASDAIKPFESFSEQMAAQRDPRYKNDPAYRDEVTKRIAVSDNYVNPRAHGAGL
jgi:hypothetical protein